MNASGFRFLNIRITQTTAETLERLQQRIINSNTGEQAIDNEEVPNYTAQKLVDDIFNIGLYELNNGDWDIVYHEETRKWKPEKDFDALKGELLK